MALSVASKALAIGGRFFVGMALMPEQPVQENVIHRASCEV